MICSSLCIHFVSHLVLSSSSVSRAPAAEPEAGPAIPMAANNSLSSSTPLIVSPLPVKPVPPIPPLRSSNPAGGGTASTSPMGAQRSNSLKSPSTPPPATTGAPGSPAQGASATTTFRASALDLRSSSDCIVIDCYLAGMMMGARRGSTTTSDSEKK